MHLMRILRMTQCRSTFECLSTNAYMKCIVRWMFEERPFYGFSRKFWPRFSQIHPIWELQLWPDAPRKPTAKTNTFRLIACVCFAVFRFRGKFSKLTWNINLKELGICYVHVTARSLFAGKVFMAANEFSVTFA